MGRQAIRTVVGALLAALLVMPPWSADLLPAPLDQLSPEPAAAQSDGEVIKFPDSRVTVSQCSPAPEPYLQEYEKEYPLGYLTWSVDSGDPHLMTPPGSTQPMHVYPRWEKVSPADPNDPHRDYLMSPITPSTTTTGTPRYVIPKWTVHPRDPRLCSVEVSPCPPSPLANPKNHDGTPNPDGRMKLSEDELGICEDVATNSDDPDLVDRCLRRLDENGNPLGSPSHPVGVLGFVNVYDDGKGECKLRLPSRCPPGLYQISQDLCRGIYRRTWTCPSTHPIRRNQFGTCYSTLDMGTILQGNNMKHPACVGMVPATVVSCERYVGDDFLQNPQNLNEPCKAINDIMGSGNDLKIVLEVRDSTPLPDDAADKDNLQRQVLRDSARDDRAWVNPTFDPPTPGDTLESITYQRNFDDPSKPGTADPLEPIQPDSSQKLNKHWCEYDKRYLNLDCFDPSLQSSSCNWNPPADEHRAWCIMRASQTGGCNAIARTVLCRSLQIDLRKAKAASNSDAAEAAHEDLQTMNCEPCPPRPPFQRGASATNAANCDRQPAISSSQQLDLPPDPDKWKPVHYARFARQSFTVNTPACSALQDKMEDDFRQGIVANYDPSNYPGCLDSLCPPLTTGKIDWESTHISGRAFTGAPVSFTITDAPFTKVTQPYLFVRPRSWRLDRWTYDPFDKKSQYFDASKASSDRIPNYMEMRLEEKSFWILGKDDTGQRLRLFDTRDDVGANAYDHMSSTLKGKECYPHNKDSPELSISIRKLWPDIPEDRQEMCRLFGIDSIERWNDSDPSTQQCPRSSSDPPDLSDEQKEMFIAGHGIPAAGKRYMYFGNLTSSQDKDAERSLRLRTSIRYIECEIHHGNAMCPSGWKPESTGFYEVKATAIWNLKVLTADAAPKKRPNNLGFATDPNNPRYNSDSHGAPLDEYHGLLATLLSAEPENDECLGYKKALKDTIPQRMLTKNGTTPYTESDGSIEYVPEGKFINHDKNTGKPKYEVKLQRDGNIVWGMGPNQFLTSDSLNAALRAKNTAYHQKSSSVRGTYDIGIEADLDCLVLAVTNGDVGMGLSLEDVGLSRHASGYLEPLPFDQPPTAPLTSLCPTVRDIRFKGNCSGVSAAGYVTSEPIGIAVYETMTVSR